jgi:hypothetical protein
MDRLVTSCDVPRLGRGRYGHQVVIDRAGLTRERTSGVRRPERSPGPGGHDRRPTGTYGVGAAAGAIGRRMTLVLLETMYTMAPITMTERMLMERSTSAIVSASPWGTP